MAETASPQQKTSGLVTVFRAVAILTLAGIIVQFGLAGFGAFDGVHLGTAAHDISHYDMHKAVGYSIAGLGVVLLLIAALARLGGQVMGTAAALVVLAGLIQPILAKAGTGSGAIWGGLHALDGIVILGLGWMLIRFGAAGPKS